jgi:hypothetical protein
MSPTRKIETPLDAYLADIAKVYAAGFFYLSIVAALSVPDICSSLELAFNDQRRFKVQKRYEAWCKKYLEPRYDKFTAEDCWALRGGVIHNGQLFGHPNARYSRVVFTTTVKMYEATSELFGQTVLQMDVARFGESMIFAAWEWYDEKRDDPLVIANMPNLIHMRPQGTAHFQGMPVIA